jgi:hypothetical protein
MLGEMSNRWKPPHLDSLLAVTLKTPGACARPRRRR